jgi:pilus assembly protein CpaB
VSDAEKRIKQDFGDEVSVVVATQDINEFDVVQASMLRVTSVPKRFAQPSSNPDPKVFEGTVASAPIRKGEQVLLTKVIPKVAETGLATQIGINFRAISLPVNDTTGVTKLIKPGDRVDVVTTVQYQVGEAQDSEVKTILQNVHVLAVGEQIQNAVPSAFEEDPLTRTRRAVNMRGSRAFGTVTVEVSPRDVQALIYVINSGANIFLSLRNPVDRVIASIPTSTVNDVLGSDSNKARREAEIAARNRPPPPQNLTPVIVPRINPLVSGGSLAK